MGGVGGLCSLPSRFTPSSYDRCNLVLQRVDTGTQPLQRCVFQRPTPTNHAIPPTANLPSKTSYLLW